MADLDLGPIRERLAGISPAAWREDAERVKSADWTLSLVQIRAADEDLVCEIAYPDYPPHIANCALIAHAPTDLAALCAEVESLRTQLAEARAEADRRAVLLAWVLDPFDPYRCPAWPDVARALGVKWPDHGAPDDAIAQMSAMNVAAAFVGQEAIRRAKEVGGGSV